MKELVSSLLNLKLTAEAPTTRGRASRDESPGDMQTSFERSLARTRQAEDQRQLKSTVSRSEDRSPRQPERVERSVAKRSDDRPARRQELAERHEPARSQPETAESAKSSRVETDAHDQAAASKEVADGANTEVGTTAESGVKGEAQGDKKTAGDEALAAGVVVEGDEASTVDVALAPDPALLLSLTGEVNTPVIAEEGASVTEGELAVAVESELTDASMLETAGGEGADATALEPGAAAVMTAAVLQSGAAGAALSSGEEGAEADTEGSPGQGRNPAALAGLMERMQSAPGKSDPMAAAGQEMGRAIDAAALKALNAAALTTVASPVALQAALGGSNPIASGNVMTLPGNLLGQGAAFAAMQSAVGGDMFGEELAQKMSLFVGKGLQSAQLILNPAELGPLEIKLHLHKDQAQIQVQSSVPMVRELVEASAQRLRDMLAEQGVELSRFDVGARHSGQEQGNNGQGREAGGSAGEPGDETASGSTAQTLVLKSDQLVDFYA